MTEQVDFAFFITDFPSLEKVFVSENFKKESWRGSNFEVCDNLFLLPQRGRGISWSQASIRSSETLLLIFRFKFLSIESSCPHNAMWPRSFTWFPLACKKIRFMYLGHTCICYSRAHFRRILLSSWVQFSMAFFKLKSQASAFWFTVNNTYYTSMRCGRKLIM